MTSRGRSYPLEYLLLKRLSQFESGIRWKLRSGLKEGTIEGMAASAHDGHRALVWLKKEGLARRVTSPNKYPEWYGPQKTISTYLITDKGRKLLKELGL